MACYGEASVPLRYRSFGDDGLAVAVDRRWPRGTASSAVDP
jgi:hypothetical protein